MRKVSLTKKPSFKEVVKKLARKRKPGTPGQATALFGPHILDLTIEGTPPNYANARMHWRVKHTSVTLWADFVIHSLANIPFDWQIIKPRLTLTLHGINEPDFDNLVSRWKPILDGLVRAKIIEDDRISVIGSPTFHWKKVNKLLDQRVHIVVESSP